MAKAKGGYDRDAAVAAREATLASLHADLAERVGSLDSVAEWTAWLRFATGFHRYSFNNTVLIWSQRPDATLVAGYRAWQAKGRQVRRGETAIRVLGPVLKREPKTDRDGNLVRDAEGKPVMGLQMVGVKPVSVFDVSQTDGDPLPEPPEAELLTGQAPPGLWVALQALVEGEGYVVSRGECGGANGVTDFEERSVRVRDDIDDAQAVKTLAHEAGHVLLHAPERRVLVECRGLIEVEAESVAYLVTAAHGLDASQYTFNYVAGWAHQAATTDGPSVEEIVRSTGQRVIGTADRILQATQPGPDEIDEALVALADEVGTKLALAPVVEPDVAAAAESAVNPESVTVPAVAAQSDVDAPSEFLTRPAAPDVGTAADLAVSPGSGTGPVPVAPTEAVANSEPLTALSELARVRVDAQSTLWESAPGVASSTRAVPRGSVRPPFSAPAR